MNSQNHSSFHTIFRTFALFVLLACVIGVQVGYDATADTTIASAGSGVTPEFIRLTDMGFHSAVGSFLWVATMPQILDLFFNNHTEYLTDFSFMTSVDPKFGYPYAFSVITLPAITSFPNRDRVALAIGQQGIDKADPDWRIPYYMGADYFLDLKDEADALKYYDIAARTPGIPVYAETFALNFGAIPNERQKAEAFWASVRDTTNDELTKERAQAYIERLQMFDYLEAAVNQYKTLYGTYPKNLNVLVTKKIIPQIPQDPFGYTFQLYGDGTVGIDQSKPPGPNALE